MPGLDKTRFVGLPENLEDEFTCGICHDIFNQPMVVPCCRQTFCDECIRQWLAQNNCCPNDRTALSPSGLYQAPNALVNILNGFRIRCEYAPNGCTHVCALENLATHMRNGCAFNPARMCTDCGGIKDENSAHNCIQTLTAITKSAGESIRDVLPAVAQMAEQFERQREQYDTAISRMESLIELLQTNESVLQTKVLSLSETLNTVLAEVSTLKEENRSLRNTRPMTVANQPEVDNTIGACGGGPTLKPLYCAKSWEELTKKAEKLYLEMDITSNIEEAIQTGDRLYGLSKAADLDGDEEYSYIQYFRYLQTISNIQKLSNYLKEKHLYEERIGMSRVREAQQLIEQLIQSLKKRYSEQSSCSQSEDNLPQEWN